MLGKGTFGEVFLVREIQSGKTKALKKTWLSDLEGTHSYSATALCVLLSPLTLLLVVCWWHPHL